MSPKLMGGVPSPNDGPEPAAAGAAGCAAGGAAGGKPAVNINRRLKSTANGEGVPPGVPPPNDGPEPSVSVAAGGKSAVNINRRLKSTANGEGVVGPSGVPTGVPPPNDGSEPAIAIKNNDTCTPHNATSCCIGNLAATARRCGVAESQSCEASRDEAMEQLSNNYLASLSELERRVCSIAKDHLESSFDLSRSGGYIAWVGKK